MVSVFQGLFFPPVAECPLPSTLCAFSAAAAVHDARWVHRMLKSQITNTTHQHFNQKYFHVEIRLRNRDCDDENSLNEINNYR